MDEGMIISMETYLSILEMIVVEEDDWVRQLENFFDSPQNIPYIDIAIVRNNHIHDEYILCLFFSMLNFYHYFMQLGPTLLKHILLIIL